MTTAELNLRRPVADQSQYVDWSASNVDDMDDTDRYTWWETFEYEYEGETFTLMASNGAMVGAHVEGDYFPREDIESEEADERCPELDWNTLRAAMDDFDRTSCPAQQGATGPAIMYYWPVADGDVNAAAWAGKLGSLPLCVVEMDDEDTVGLALTGGGMDLSWEIGAAYVALGYYPPTSLSLPKMAGLDERNEPHRSVARALVEALRLQAFRSVDAAERVMEQYPNAFTDGERSNPLVLTYQ